jgi:hypothetical protein
VLSLLRKQETSNSQTSRKNRTPTREENFTTFKYYQMIPTTFASDFPDEEKFSSSFKS